MGFSIPSILKSKLYGFKMHVFLEQPTRWRQQPQHSRIAAKGTWRVILLPSYPVLHSDMLADASLLSF